MFCLQLEGKAYNEKVDVFSLGLIFVELIFPFTTVMERSRILSGLQNNIMPKCLDNLPSKEVKDGSSFSNNFLNIGICQRFTT